MKDIEKLIDAFIMVAGCVEVETRIIISHTVKDIFLDGIANGYLNGSEAQAYAQKIKDNAL